MNEAIRKRVGKLEMQSTEGGRLEEKVGAFCAKTNLRADVLLKAVRAQGAEVWLDGEMSSEGQVTWPTFNALTEIYNGVRVASW